MRHREDFVLKIFDDLVRQLADLKRSGVACLITSSQ